MFRVTCAIRHLLLGDISLKYPLIMYLFLLLRFADTANKLQLQLKRIKPLLLAGLSHTNPTVFELCFTILSSVDLLTPEERQQMLGMLDMTPDDPLSIVMSKYEAIKALSKASRMDNRAGGIVSCVCR